MGMYSFSGLPFWTGAGKLSACIDDGASIG